MNRIAGFSYTVLLVIMAVGCSLDPGGERPGFGLSEKVDSDPNPDWSFTDAYREISIETHTLYFLPHSVTIWCVTIGNRLYVAAMNPEEKRWVANVDRDPDRPRSCERLTRASRCRRSSMAM